MTAFTVVAAPRAEAQTLDPALSVRWGAVNYDMSGTGTSAGIAVTHSRPLLGSTTLELGALIARPLQQTGHSTLVVPEAHVQYHWSLGRIAPYVTGGGGMALIYREFDTRVRPALSAGGGARFALTDHVGVQGELRLRVIGSNFSASTAEWLAGLVWKI